MFQLFVGDRSPAITDVIAIAGQAQDVTNLAVTFNMRDRDTGIMKITAAPATKTNGGADGAVQYDWAAADVDTAANYLVWWEVTLEAGVIQSKDAGEVQIVEHENMYLTIAEVRSVVETGLEDDALQIFIDDALQTIERRFGSLHTQVIEVDARGCSTIHLARPAQTLISVEDMIIPQIYTALDLSTLALEHGGRTIRLMNPNLWGWYSGYGSWFGRHTRVTYVPISDVAVRRRVAIDLVRLATQYRGLEREVSGDYTAISMPDYEAARENLLCQIQNTRGKFRVA